MNRAEIIDLNSPVSVKSRQDFIPFKAHLKSSTEEIVDLCTPVKVTTAASSSSFQGNTSVLFPAACVSGITAVDNGASTLIEDNTSWSYESSFESEPNWDTILIDNSTEDYEPTYHDQNDDQSSKSVIIVEKQPVTIAVHKEDKETSRKRFFASLDAKKRGLSQSSTLDSSTSNVRAAPEALIAEDLIPVKKSKASTTPQKLSKKKDATELVAKAAAVDSINAAPAVNKPTKKPAKPRAAKTTTVAASATATHATQLVCNAPLLSEVNPAAVRSSSFMLNNNSSSLTNSLPTSGSSSSSATVINYHTLEPVEKVMASLLPGVEYEVVLIVDKREQENPRIQSKMVECNIPCELSTLAVGDFLWIARPKAQYFSSSSGSSSSSSGNTSTLLASYNQTTSSSSSSGGGGVTLFDEDSCASIESEIPLDIKDMRAVVLDCIAERKSTKDLASSIIDHRYLEQKSRLRACGVRSCVYIVEGELAVAQQAKKMTVQHLKTAMIETHAEGNMHVFRTRSLDHTMDCLKAMHWQVVRRFKKGACGELFQTFPNFQKLWGKKTAGNYRQLFGYQLRQIQGCSKNVALPVINRFGSTHNFIREMEKLGKVQGTKLVAEMVKLTGKSGRDFKIGKIVAERIWNTYMEDY